MKFNRSLLQRLAGWSVLIFVPLILFAKPISRGEVLIPTDILPVVDDVWAAKVTPNNPLLSDILLQFYPWQKFSAATIARGEWPLWNPYTMAGAPLLANDQSATFEPLKFLTLIIRFPVEHSFLFLAVGRLMLFGFFIAWWLRLRGFSTSVAVIIGAAGAVSAPAVAWLAYPLFATFLWLPLILVGLEYLSRRERRGWLITAGAIAAQWFSGNIQISIFILLFTAVYSLIMLRPSWRTVLTMSASVLLGTGIAAVQLLPSANYIRQSPVYESGRGGYGETNFLTAVRDGSWRGWESLADARQSLERLLPVASPFVNGNPASGKYRFPGGDVYANMNELAGSVGAMALLLSIIGVFAGWRERLVKFSVGVAAIVIGAMAHVPVVELINTLPLLQQTQTDRLRFVLAFCLLILAAFGLRAMFDRRVAWKKTAAIAGIYFAALVLIGWKVGIGSDWKTEVVFLGVSLVLGLGSFARRLTMTSRSVILGTALFIGPIILWQGYNTSVHRENTVSQSSVLAELQRRMTAQDRFVSFGVGRGRTPLEPNTAVLYELQDIRGYDVVRLKRYDELVDGVLTRSGSHLKGATEPGEVLNALAVRYGFVATRDLHELDPVLSTDGWTVIAEDATVRLYENAKWQPRAWFTSNVQEVAHPSESLAAVRSDSFSADVPIIETGKNIPANGESVVAPALITDTGPNAVVVTVNAPRAGYVILADAYADGWMATVDGQSADIVPANHALRAVKTSAGEHTITFTYKPNDFLLGRWVSIGSVLSLIGLGWLSRRRAV